MTLTEITDFYAPELDVYARLTEAQLLNRFEPKKGMFIAESPKVHIEHKLIRPRTPWHNGKVERSHRNDQERFYNYLKFYSFADLQTQMKRYLRRSNSIPMAVLGWKSPNQMQLDLETPSS